MKKRLTGAALTALTVICSQNAKAEIYKVLVQCDEAGPVYNGTLDIPNQNQIKCDRMGLVESTKVPVVLRFESLAYVIGTDRLFIDNGCNVKTLNANTASGVEMSTSLEKDFEMNAIKGGYDGTLGHCGFKTQP